MTHLIGDLAQPAHTRDDSHAHTNIAGVEIGDDSDDFETFMVRPDNQHRIAGFKAFDPGNPSVFKVATGDGIAKAPVAWIWDTNRYVKTTPDEANPAVTVGSNIGLAEFSSANFFSHDTIYQTTSDNVDLPYPAINRLGVGPLEPYPPTGEERQYLSRCEGPPSCQYGVFVEHMVAEGIFFRFTPPFIVTAANYVLDDLVFTDYAAELMPRAIGYSSSLLDYFFRAEIDLVVDPANPGQYLIKNLSSDPMDGVFELHYDDVNGERQFPVETERVTVPAGGTLPFIFDAPADAATPGEYILVFKGGIGLEGDGGSDSEFAVAAKVVTLPVTGLIRTSGGDALGFAAPGDGGVVVLEAGADIPQMASATGPLFVPPGQTVTLSGADLTYTEIDVRGTLEIIGVATLASHGATSITGTVTAMRDERNGADLTIESVGPTAITGRIVTAGMNGEDLGGTTETGGRGGNVTIRTESTGTFTVPTIVTRGGDANRTDLRSPQTTFDGGWGGDVTVMTHGVPIRFAGDKISSGSVDRLPPGSYTAPATTIFLRGVLTTGGYGGESTVATVNGSSGGAGGSITIDCVEPASVDFDETRLFTGGNIDWNLGYNIQRVRQSGGSVSTLPFAQPAGAIGGRGGPGGATANGGSGGRGGEAGSILVTPECEIGPQPASFQRPTARYFSDGYDIRNFATFQRPPRVDAFDAQGKLLYAVQAFGGGPGFPGGSGLTRAHCSITGASCFTDDPSSCPATPQSQICIGDAAGDPGRFGTMGASGAISCDVLLIPTAQRSGLICQ